MKTKFPKLHVTSHMHLYWINNFMNKNSKIVETNKNVTYSFNYNRLNYKKLKIRVKYKEQKLNFFKEFKKFKLCIKIFKL